MNVLAKLIILYLILINIISFASMGIDKYKAKHNKWRIPEKTLFLLSGIGGSLGAYLGMYAFHHKTKHTYFVIGFPTILLIHIIIFIFIFTKF